MILVMPLLRVRGVHPRGGLTFYHSVRRVSIIRISGDCLAKISAYSLVLLFPAFPLADVHSGVRIQKSEISIIPALCLSGAC